MEESGFATVKDIKDTLGSKHLGESNPNNADIEQNIAKMKDLFPLVVFQDATFNAPPFPPHHQATESSWSLLQPTLPRHC